MRSLLRGAAALCVALSLFAARAHAQEPPAGNAAYVYPTAHDDERPGRTAPPSVPAAPRDDGTPVGATAQAGGAAFADGVGESMFFALRIGGPHFRLRGAAPRAISVDLGVGTLESGPTRQVAGEVVVRDYHLVTSWLAPYVLLGFAAGDVTRNRSDAFVFSGAAGAGLSFGLCASLALDVEARAVMRLVPGLDDNYGAELGAQVTAGITVYLGA